MLAALFIPVAQILVQNFCTQSGRTVVSFVNVAAVKSVLLLTYIHTLTGTRVYTCAVQLCDVLTVKSTPVQSVVLRNGARHLQSCLMDVYWALRTVFATWFRSVFPKMFFSRTPPLFEK